MCITAAAKSDGCSLSPPHLHACIPLDDGLDEVAEQAGEEDANLQRGGSSGFAHI